MQATWYFYQSDEYGGPFLNLPLLYGVVERSQELYVAIVKVQSIPWER